MQLKRNIYKIDIEASASELGKIEIRGIEDAFNGQKASLFIPPMKADGVNVQVAIDQKPGPAVNIIIQDGTIMLLGNKVPSILNGKKFKLVKKSH